MTMHHDDVRNLAAGFVLGALEPAEEQAVREHLATCHEPHEEFSMLGGVVPYLDDTVELVEPPASLKARVVAAAAADLAADPGSRVRPTTHRREVVASSTRGERTRSTRRSPLAWVTAIAAVIVIAGLAGWNLMLQSQLREAADYNRAVSSVLDVGARPGSQVAILSGARQAGPHGIAAIGGDGSFAMTLRDLPPSMGNEVYEAWIVGSDGAPVPLGGFQVGSSGTVMFTGSVTPSPGATIALTREPGPGATTPTLPIISSGVAAAPPKP
jgi:anti-sigma-K factor RskA